MHGDLEFYRVFRKRDFAAGPEASKLYICKIGEAKPTIWIQLKTLKNLEFYQKAQEAMNALEKEEKLKVLSYHQESSASINPELIFLTRRRE